MKHGIFGFPFLGWFLEDFPWDDDPPFLFFQLFFFLPPGCLVSLPLSNETAFTSEARSSYAF